MVHDFKNQTIEKLIYYTYINHIYSNERVAIVNSNNSLKGDVDHKRLRTLDLLDGSYFILYFVYCSWDNFIIEYEYI